MDTNEPRTFIDIHQLANMIGVSRGTIHNWRALGTGPTGYKFGTVLRFELSDVEDWIAQRRDAQ